MNLLDYATNTYSQSGEDGILSRILETLPRIDKWCVEFGAWDGEHLSNTRNLIQNCQYSGVLIEADMKRFTDLLQRHSNSSKVIALNRLVGFTANDGLDTLLKETPIPKDFDVLSIDIDGNDYHVWNAVCVYEPKIVCIEYNPTIPTEIDFVQPADARINQGASLQALNLLAKRKGYELIAATTLNAFFVRSEYFPLFGILDNTPSVLRKDCTQITHIFCGYDGTIFISGRDSLLWHGISYRSRIRQLPKPFRSYPGSFGRLKSKLFKIYQMLNTL